MRIVVFFMTVLMLSCNNSQAFDNKDTHPSVTRFAAIKSNFETYLINNLGFKDGLNTTFEIDSEKYILKWLTIGSNEEDTLTSMCRASNHFHNPLLEWKDAYLSDQAWWQPVICMNWRPIHSALTWATGYLTPPGSSQTKDSFSSDPDYVPVNWDTARDSYYTALTASVPADREESFAKTFKSIGHVLHLLRDMAVPAHMRNKRSLS